MSVYICCPYDCRHKDIARNVFLALSNAGLKSFYNGDVPEDRRIDRRLGCALMAAIDRCTVFIPILCKEFGQGLNVCGDELAVATSDKKIVIPVCVDPDHVGIKPGGLLTGIRITDVSSPSKYETELPELIRTIRAMIPAPNVHSGRATGSEADVKDDSESGSEKGDQDA